MNVDAAAHDPRTIRACRVLNGNLDHAFEMLRAVAWDPHAFRAMAAARFAHAFAAVWPDTAEGYARVRAFRECRLLPRR